MAAPNRRSLITAAAAFAGGAAIAGPAVAAVSALASADPLPSLLAERNRIFAIEGRDDDETDAICEQINRLENRIADTVAVSAAGLIAQVELLKGDYLESGWVDKRDFRLCDTIIAGIQRLGGAA
jgi:hypothetical protein